MGLSQVIEQLLSAQSHIEKLKEIFAERGEKEAHLPLFDISVAKEDEVVGNASDDRLLALQEGLSNKKNYDKLLVSFVPRTEHVTRVDDGSNITLKDLGAHCDARHGLTRMVEHLGVLDKQEKKEKCDKEQAKKQAKILNKAWASDYKNN